MYFQKGLVIKQLLYFLILSSIYLYAAEEIIYKKSNIHAFIPEKNRLQTFGTFQKVNDDIDVFNIKESEFSSNTENFDSLGDMEGIDLNFGYAFTDNFYLNLTLNRKDIQYSNTVLVNNNLDIYLRYQFYKEENMALAVDGGYAFNKAKNTYMRDLKTINKGLRNIITDKDISVAETDGNYRLVYKDKEAGTQNLNLKNKPYIAIIDTKDESFYTRVISSFKRENWLFDAYVGYSEMRITNKTDSSIIHEENPFLEEALKDISLSDKEKRTDTMFFVGLGVTHQISHLWFAELNYQYNHMQRVKCLSETNMNHIFNLNFIYDVTRNTSFYLGGTVMSNQFNGDIPYLYGEYTDTSFDHKYGFINMGLSYNF